MERAHALRLFRHFLRRQLQQRYLGSLSGFAWALLQPLAQLLLYAWLIGSVLRARIPEAEGVGFAAYVAVGLWPWLMFSEGVMRATTSVVDNASLIGKVALPPAILVAADAAASVFLHAAGFMAVLLVLALTTTKVHLAGLPMAILLLCALSVLTLGFAYLAAGLQVFVRDLAHFLSQLFAFLFFLTPILYAPSMLPEWLRPWLSINPLSYYPPRLRELLIGESAMPQTGDFIAIGVALIALWIGYGLFRRLQPRFEDFL